MSTVKLCKYLMVFIWFKATIFKWRIKIIIIMICLKNKNQFFNDLIQGLELCDWIWLNFIPRHCYTPAEHQCGLYSVREPGDYFLLPYICRILCFDKCAGRARYVTTIYVHVLPIIILLKMKLCFKMHLHIDNK